MEDMENQNKGMKIKRDLLMRVMIKRYSCKIQIDNE